MSTKKIKLLQDLPVGTEHGMTKGRVLETVKTDERGTWVIGDAGEKVKVFPREYEVVET